MFINTDISHVDEYYGLSEEERKKFDKAVLEELEKTPPKHLETEWGRFQKLTREADEEVENLIDNILKEMTLEQKIYQMSGDNLPKHAGVNLPLIMQEKTWNSIFPESNLQTVRRGLLWDTTPLHFRFQ